MIYNQQRKVFVVEDNQHLIPDIKQHWEIRGIVHLQYWGSKEQDWLDVQADLSDLTHHKHSEDPKVTSDLSYKWKSFDKCMDS